MLDGSAAPRKDLKLIPGEIHGEFHHFPDGFLHIIENPYTFARNNPVIRRLINRAALRAISPPVTVQ